MHRLLGEKCYQAIKDKGSYKNKKDMYIRLVTTTENFTYVISFICA